MNREQQEVESTVKEARTEEGRGRREDTEVVGGEEKEIEEDRRQREILIVRG